MSSFCPGASPRRLTSKWCEKSGLVLLLGLATIVLPVKGAATTGIYRYVAPDGSVHFTDEPRRREDRPFVVSNPGGGGQGHRRFAQERQVDLFDGPVERAAAATGLDSELIHAVIAVESGYRPAALSPKGAMGLMQLMPDTAAELGVQDPYDPEENIVAGARYLRGLWERFDDLTLALAAYNAGPERVVRYGGVPPFEETRNYLRHLRDLYPGGGWHRSAPTGGGTEVIYQVRLADGSLVFTNSPP